MFTSRNSHYEAFGNKCVDACENGDLKLLQSYVESREWNECVEVKNKVYMSTCKNGQIDIISFLTSVAKDVDLDHIVFYVYTLAVSHNQQGLIEWCINNDQLNEVVTPTLHQFALNTAFSNGNWKLLDFLVMHGIKTNIQFIRFRGFVSKYDTAMTLKIAHTHRLHSEIIPICKTSYGKVNMVVCKLCNAEKVGDMWEMDVNEFDNIIQWLPHEMVMDTLELLH